MFPHTVTVINIVDKVFYSQIVSDVFYLEDKIISQDGLGEKYQNVHRCIFSNTALSKYVLKTDFEPNTGTFTLKTNDIIVKGETTATTIEELEKNGCSYFLIKSIADHSDYGSEELRNIEVTD